MSNRWTLILHTEWCVIPRLHDEASSSSTRSSRQALHEQEIAPPTGDDVLWRVDTSWINFPAVVWFYILL